MPHSSGRKKKRRTHFPDEPKIGFIREMRAFALHEVVTVPLT
jgi:hypothetical protein